MENVIDNDTIRSEIEDGLHQVDESFVINSLTCTFDDKNRKLNVGFSATNERDETIEIDNIWE